MRRSVSAGRLFGGSDSRCRSLRTAHVDAGGESARGAPQEAGASGPVDAATDEPGERATVVPDGGDTDVAAPRENPSLCPPGVTYGSPLGAGARATLVRDGFHFCEGPVWFARWGALFFSDMNVDAPDENGVPPSTIHRFTPPDTFEDFIIGAGSNGLALAPDGNLLAATHDVQSISRYDVASKARATLRLTYQGHHFNSPNDLAIRSDGNIYFTDPDYQRGSRPTEIGGTGVYRVSPNQEVTRLALLNEPNGVTLSPDENVLYMDDADGELLRFEVRADGSVGEATRLAALESPDGMAIDCAGNLYVATGFHGTVDVLDPSGARLGAIDVPGQVTNAAFGGQERKTLYITSGNALHVAELGVPGLPY
jgi:gluconolactonase